MNRLKVLVLEPIKNVDNLDSFLILDRSFIQSKDIFRIAVFKRLEWFDFSLISGFIL